MPAKKKTTSKKTKTSKTAPKKTTKKGGKKKTSKKTKAAEPAPVVEEAPAVEAVPAEAVPAEAVPAEAAGSSVDDAFTSLLGHIAALTSELSSIKKEVNALRRQVRAENKDAAKNLKSTEKELEKLKKKNERKADRKPGGVNKPTLMSDELCTFLGMDKGSSMAPCHLTSKISSYVKEKGLALKGLNFKTDKKLKKLLNFDGDELSYGNLQKYTSPLFVRN